MSDELTGDVTHVPLSQRGQVLTPAAKVLENGIFLAQFLLLGAAALVPVILGGWAAMRPLFPGNDALSFAPVLIGLALTAAVVWFLGGKMLRKPWSADFMFHRTQDALSQRPDALVDPRTPEAIYVEVIPRRNWGQVSLQNAEDVGFLHLDAEGRQLLIEGDNKRYRIPAAAIISCETELMNEHEPDDEYKVPLGVVVLKVRDRMGEREIPLRPVRTVSGDALGGNYVERARELCERIERLRSAPPVESLRRSA